MSSTGVPERSIVLDAEAPPELRKVLARDVVPDEWAVWCRFTDDEFYGRKPFANTIEYVTWSEDGEHLWFTLGTHNFKKVRPDELLELVPVAPPSYDTEERRRQRRDKHAALIVARPVMVIGRCASCDGRGIVRRRA